MVAVPAHLPPTPAVLGVSARPVAPHTMGVAGVRRVR